MPVKRRLHKGRQHRITDDAVQAYKAGDVIGLHRALQLRPWQQSPLDIDNGPCPGHCDPEGWALAQELQRELESCR